MAIVKTVDLNDFRQEFRDCGRTENFSYHGLEVLFDYLEELSEDIGEPIELCVIALCCEYSEGTPEEIAEAYSIDLPDSEAVMNAVLDFLYNNTSVCGVTDSGTIVHAIF